jgi:hypothetical protein
VAGDLGDDCRLLIADCRLKKWCGNFLSCQSAIGNRKSAIPAILGQTMIAQIIRKQRIGFRQVLQAECDEP